MNSKTRKKLCWNCEGTASIDHENCPYCGVTLTVSPLLQDVKSPYSPPYRLTEPSSSPIIPSSPYNLREDQVNDSAASEQESQPSSEPVVDNLKATLVGLLFSLFGAVFLIFGFTLWLFSDQHGVLTLSWNGHYWFIYLLAGLPLLIGGWRATSKIKEEEL